MIKDKVCVQFILRYYNRCLKQSLVNVKSFKKTEIHETTLRKSHTHCMHTPHTQDTSGMGTARVNQKK